jgi:hypothetical protein
MVGLTSLEEQVDRDFSRARRKAMLRRIGTRLRRDAGENLPGHEDGPCCSDRGQRRTLF